MRLKSVLVLTLILGALPTVASAQTYQLASAQVVTSTSGPPVLKVAANGPIAFAVEAAGEDAMENRIVVRLYGVVPGAAGVLTNLEPFSMSAVRVGDDTRLTIAAAGLGESQELRVRAGVRSNELEITTVERLPQR